MKTWLSALVLALMIPASLAAQGTGHSASDPSNPWLRIGQRLIGNPSQTYLSSNPYLGTPLSKYDRRLSPYSPNGALNPYTTQGGMIYAQDGTFLGRLNANRYDPNSVANPYGRFGSPYSPRSINNPYGTYGSPYSSLSPNNPYTRTPPIVVYPHR